MKSDIASEFVRTIHDPYLVRASISEMVKNGHGKFYLCLGSTCTSDIEGISAAGANADQRRLTPALDADILLYGQPAHGQKIPVSPSGIVSPVVISRACLNLLPIETKVVECGSFHTPESASLIAGTTVARCLSTGEALAPENVISLFEAGRRVGAEAIKDADYVILGECVPAGTTTALAVLTALGHQANSLVSGSFARRNNTLREQIVKLGLERANLKSEINASEIDILDPLKIISAVGDPMQPFVLGFALAAATAIPVILGGGSQMLAIYALLRQCIKLYIDDDDFQSRISIFTTKWVAYDQFADTNKLSRLLNAPLFAACPDFHQSRHPGLRAYEEGHVKEGVAAGALMAVSHFATGMNTHELMPLIDNMYDALVGLPQNAINSEPVTESCL